MKTKRNLLIVCEGTATEPEYFHQLRDYLKSKEVDYHISIKPKPPTEKNAEKLAAEQAALPNGRPSGKRRQMEKVDVPEEEFMVEDEYSAQPTRYVREAQLGLIDGTYEEAWAVFDQDGHAEHLEATKLATDNPQCFVHIGFTSVAFEHWILLHYEYCNLAFRKSECRHGKVYIECGQNKSGDDCKGAHCLAGYMKNKGYVESNKNIKQVGYKDLASKTNTALINALALRKAQLASHIDVPTYQINPITTVDRLVLKLLKEPLNIIWAYVQPLKHNHQIVQFNIVQDELQIKIKNQANVSHIYKEGDFIAMDVLGNEKNILERFVMDADSTIDTKIDLAALMPFVPVYAGIRIDVDQYYMIEI